MSWGNNVVLEFLELYRREQLLWDPRHPLHRNRSEVADAWIRIQTSMSINCSVIDLKKKKESLMTSFRMHLNKKKKAPEGYRTTWFAYPLMESFLGGKYECDSTNEMEHEFYETSVAAYSNMQPPMQDPNLVRSMNNRLPQKPVGTKFSKTNEFKSPKKEMDEAVSLLKRVARERKDMDEYELYGQLLAKKLRKLDERQRDLAMHEIDDIMFRAKLQSGPADPRHYSTSPTPAPRKVNSPVFIVAQPNRLEYEDEDIPYQEHMQGQPPS